MVSSDFGNAAKLVGCLRDLELLSGVRKLCLRDLGFFCCVVGCRLSHPLWEFGRGKSVPKIRCALEDLRSTKPESFCSSIAPGRKRFRLEVRSGTCTGVESLCAIGRDANQNENQLVII